MRRRKDGYPRAKERARPDAHGARVEDGAVEVYEAAGAEGDVVAVVDDEGGVDGGEGGEVRVGGDGGEL